MYLILHKSKSIVVGMHLMIYFDGTPKICAASGLLKAKSATVYTPEAHATLVNSDFEIEAGQG